MIRNPLLFTDVYKLGHMRQYPKDTTEVYSYLEARKPDKKVIWFGLQYYLKEYLAKPVQIWDVEEFCKIHEGLLGSVPEDVKKKIDALQKLGYWPVEIKAPAEGTVVKSQNALMTIRNTHPDFYWCVGFLESLLLKVWYPCTVASASRRYYELVERFAELTCDNKDHLPFQVHDFGYRGVSSEESAAIAGASHLLNFSGSDTVTANAFLNYYYNAGKSVKGLSVPASEHSVMCSYGREGEWDAFDTMLDLYPEGIVSIVSDSYDYWKILTDYAPARKERIMSRNGKVVFRPDSGNQLNIICGVGNEEQLPSAWKGWFSTEEQKGSLELLWDTFGGTVNSKGYRVLDSHVGLIYGDGMTYDRFEAILQRMKEQGFASSNLVIGVGGILLQNHSRDEFGFALKATRIKKADGTTMEIFKDPVTDSSKKSKCGLVGLFRYPDSDDLYTMDHLTEEEEKYGVLRPVFLNGKILQEWSYNQVKTTLQESP